MGESDLKPEEKVTDHHCLSWFYLTRTWFEKNSQKKKNIEFADSVIVEITNNLAVMQIGTMIWCHKLILISHFSAIIPLYNFIFSLVIYCYEHACKLA